MANQQNKAGFRRQPKVFGKNPVQELPSGIKIFSRVEGGVCGYDVRHDENKRN